MIAFLYYTEWYFIFPLYFKNYFQKMAAISYRQRDWFHGTIKENKGGEHRMDQKEVDLNEEQELSPEELAEFMASYKKELARIYKMSSAKKSFMVRQKLPNLKMALEECDRDMRKDIDELKHKYGIHY